MIQVEYRKTSHTKIAKEKAKISEFIRMEIDGNSDCDYLIRQYKQINGEFLGKRSHKYFCSEFQKIENEVPPIIQSIADNSDSDDSYEEIECRKIEIRGNTYLIDICTNTIYQYEYPHNEVVGLEYTREIQELYHRIGNIYIENDSYD